MRVYFLQSPAKPLKDLATICYALNKETFLFNNDNCGSEVSEVIFGSSIFMKLLYVIGGVLT